MKNPVSLRRMREEDLPSIADLLSQLGYDVPPSEVSRRFSAIKRLNDHRLLVAVIAGRVVGATHVFGRQSLEKPPEAIVQAIVIDRTRQRQGIGTKLMQAAECWAVEQGFGSIVLASRTDREDAHAFYRVLGYDQAANSYLMRKILKT